MCGRATLPAVRKKDSVLGKGELHIFFLSYAGLANSTSYESKTPARRNSIDMASGLACRRVSRR